jgi:hypothetical protein
MKNSFMEERFMFSMSMKTLITLSTLALIFVGAQKSLAFDEDYASQACDRLAAIYSQCGPIFNYDGKTFDFSRSGLKKIVQCNDGKNLSFYDRMDAMDMASIFMIPYQTGVTPLPETRENWDPGRLRVEPLLEATYGKTESEARANLVNVPFLNQSVMFQKKLGAANALTAVGKELMATAKTDAAVAKFLAPFTSKKINLREMTFSWRDIAGTHRRSAHSWGTAIDLLNGVGPQYWLWDERHDHPARAAKGESGYHDIHYIPTRAPIFNQKVAEIFEKHGFIWGAKWNHYDTMHFEYRPEFIAGVQINCK